MLSKILFGTLLRECVKLHSEIVDTRTVIYKYRKELRENMSALTDLRNEVAAEKEEFASAVKAISGLVTRLEEAHSGTSDEDVAAVIAEMRANIAPLAEAVVAQTPSAPQAPSEPTPVVETPVETTPEAHTSPSV